MIRVVLITSFTFIVASCTQSSVDYSQLPKNEAELSDQFKSFAADRGAPVASASSGEQLFYLQGSDSAMLSLMSVTQKAQIESLKLTKTNLDLNLLTRINELYLEEAKKDMPWVASQFSEIYENEFNENELVEIRSFFLSDVGQKWITRQPDLLSKGIKVGEGLEQRLLPRVKKRIESEIDDLKKE